MVVQKKKFQGGPDCDHCKKAPRLGLCPGAHSKSRLHSGNKLRAASWNIGSLTRKSLEIAEELYCRAVDVGCLQETRWKGLRENCCRFIGQGEGRYKLFWAGNDEGKYAGVGIVIAERLVDKVIKVHRYSDRLIMIEMVLGKVISKFVCAYAPQVGCEEELKVEFYDRLSEVLLGVKEKEFVFIGGDFNGHVGSFDEGFKGIHGGYGIGKRNIEGLKLLETCMQHDLTIINTCFKKPSKHRYTYKSSDHKTQIDYILVKESYRKYIEDCRVHEICGEYQHSLLVTVINDIKLTSWSRKDFIPKRRTWLLNKKENADKFENAVKEKWQECADNVNVTWTQYKNCVLEAADEVCGWTKAKARRKVTWWWSDSIRQVVDNKKKKFKAMKAECTEENKTAYKTASKEAKRAVAKAMEEEAKKVTEELEDKGQNGEGKAKIFRMAKQHAREKKDIVGGQAIRDPHGKLCVDMEDKKDVWKNYMEKLLNEENEWDGVLNDIEIDGEMDDISSDEVRAAMKQMRSGKACGISGVCSEFLVRSGEVGVEVMRDICNKVLRGSSMPEDWTNSLLVPLYKGKGDTRDCGSYRGIKLLEHGMKIFERILEKRLRSKIEIDRMQCGFMPGRGTIDAIFILRQLQEKYISKKKKLFFCFVDLEKAFDRVPRKLIEYALRKKGVEEKLVQAVMRLFENAKTRVRVEAELTDPFEVKVGVHQGSVLSPLLFITVMDVLSEGVRDGLLFELLYADDLVIMAESVEELEHKYLNWKRALESKGLRVNVGKTKVMIGNGVKETKRSAIDPCSICETRVKKNSIKCNTCKSWVHARCSGIKGSLLRHENTFICKKCQGHMDINTQSNGDSASDLTVQGLANVNSFCYLGDNIEKGGGCDSAVIERVRKGWLKFKELSGVLCNKRLALKIRGVLYRTCVRTVLTYGSETWPMRKENEDTLLRAERKMVRMICGVTLSNRERSEVLLSRLGLVDDISVVVRKARLRWFGHVYRREEHDGIKMAFLAKVEGTSGRGRPRKTWFEVVKNDLKCAGMLERDAKDRVKWRNAVRNLTANPRARGKRQYNNVR